MNPSGQAIWERTREQLARWWASLRRLSPGSSVRFAHPLGLALGSGGLRGAAHVGVLAVFEEQGIQPELLAGTSAGSVVAVLTAAGYTPGRMQALMEELTPELFGDFTLPRFQLLVAGATALRDYLGTNRHRTARKPSGLIRGERFEIWLHKLLGERRFDELAVPTYVVATDLTTGEAVVFGPERPVPGLPPGYCYMTGVPVVQAVRASCSIPFIFEPVEVNGHLLVDGAFADPVPARVLRFGGARTVVAVNLATAGRTGPGQDSSDYNLFQVLSRATAFLADRYSAETLRDGADMVICPCETSASLTEVEKAEEFVRQGRDAARQALSLWQGRSCPAEGDAPGVLRMLG